MRRLRALLAGVSVALACGCWSVLPDLEEPTVARATKLIARSLAEGDPPQVLEVEAFAVAVTIEGAIARTRIDVRVRNPLARQAEALIRLAVPPGAAVTGAALHVGPVRMPAIFVDRDRARAIYDSIVSRRRDPLLITWASPDLIDIAIFPLEAGDARRFELEWLEPLGPTANGGRQYRLPVLAHEGRIVRRPTSLGVARHTARTSADVSRVLTAAPDRHPTVARAPGEPFGFVLARGEPTRRRPRLVLVAEISAQMSAADRLWQAEALDRVLAALPPQTTVTLLAASSLPETLVRAAALGEARAALPLLAQRISAGALDLEEGLGAAIDLAREDEAHAVVYLGRGRDAFAGPALAAPLERLRQGWLPLLVVAGDGQAPPALADAAALSGGEVVAPADATLAVARLVERTARTPPRTGGRGRCGDTVEWAVDAWWPLDTASGERVWLARFTGAPPEPTTTGNVSWLRSLWSRARLSGNDVLTPATALLALETAQDYRRWGLSPPPGIEIAAAPERSRRIDGEEGRMGKGLSGLRGPPAPDRARAQQLVLEQARNAGQMASIFGRGSALETDPENVLSGLMGNQIGEAYGVGGLGLVGTGGSEGTIGLGSLGTIGTQGGGGSGWGYGRASTSLGGRRARAPDVIPGQASVRGSLDGEIVRRIVRRHLNEVRYCYEVQLARRPGLAGRLSVQVTIGATGVVVASVLQHSTLGDPRVESCVVQAVRRWQFPRPLGGGIVIASFPILFSAVPGVGPAWLDEPGDPWQEALARFERRKPGSGQAQDQAQDLARFVGAPATKSLDVLAWWLVTERLRPTGARFEGWLLAASLLRAAGLDGDSARVLSEAAPPSPMTVSEALRRWGHTERADRLLAISRRGQ